MKKKNSFPCWCWSLYPCTPYVNGNNLPGLPITCLCGYALIDYLLDLVMYFVFSTIRDRKEFTCTSKIVKLGWLVHGKQLIPGSVGKVRVMFSLCNFPKTVCVFMCACLHASLPLSVWCKAQVQSTKEDFYLGYFIQTTSFFINHRSVSSFSEPEQHCDWRKRG